MGSRSPSVPFTIPADSPLATGWRSTLAELLVRHGLAEVMHVISAYAELRVRHEPDDCSMAEEMAQGKWYRRPAQRQIDAKEELLAAELRNLPSPVYARRIAHGKELARRVKEIVRNETR